MIDTCLPSIFSISKYFASQLDELRNQLLFTFNNDNIFIGFF